LLTKSNLVARDIDIIQQIGKQNYACVAFTVTTADDDLAKIIEPRAPLPGERLKAMGILSVLGIKTGAVIMPTLPYITDTVKNITDIVKLSKQHGASFVYPSFSVTMRDKQRDYFFEHIDEETRNKYINRFKNYYQCTSPDYKKLKTAFVKACRELDISGEMPSYDKENSIAQLNFFKEIQKT
jgi:DNA repair photolyase